MKAVWISILLLVVLLLAILAHALYIQKITNELSALVKSIPKAAPQSDEFDKLNELWSKHRSRIGLSSSTRELDRFEESLINLQWAIEETPEQIERHRHLLLNAIDALSRNERLKLKGFFK